jgi:hypothetical protein
VVLRKLYYANALRIVPGLRASAFPPVATSSAGVVPPAADAPPSNGAAERPGSDLAG